MTKASRGERRAEAEPRLRRGYFECRFGQLHVYNAIPPGGGFEEGTPLLCVHDAPGAGRAFESFLPVMGRDRSVYAPDLPGYGGSDPPTSQPAIADYAAALGDFLDTMRFRQIDVLGYRAGSLVTAELAIARPRQVRRVTLAGVPLPTESDREAFRKAPWPVAPAEDGSHLGTEWHRARARHRAGSNLEALARDFADRLSGGPRGWWGLDAALRFPARDRLALITQPVLVLRTRDELWESSRRVQELLPNARVSELPESVDRPFESGPAAVVSLLRDFLRD